MEEGGQNTIEQLVEINLGSEENPRPTFVSASLPNDIKERLIEFLKEYID